MATQQPEADAVPTVGPVPRTEVKETIEVPYDTPEGIRQANAIIQHPESGRTVRREVTYDSENKTVTETETGLVNGEKVWQREVGGLRWASAGLVYVEGIREAMSIETYIELVAFDEAGYRLGSDFESYERSHPVVE